MKISKPLRDGTNTEKDVLSYELYVSPENPARFFLFELYKTAPPTHSIPNSPILPTGTRNARK